MQKSIKGLHIFTQVYFPSAIDSLLTQSLLGRLLMWKDCWLDVTWLVKLIKALEVLKFAQSSKKLEEIFGLPVLLPTNFFQPSRMILMTFSTFRHYSPHSILHNLLFISSKCLFNHQIKLFWVQNFLRLKEISQIISFVRIFLRNLYFVTFQLRRER